MCSFRNPERLEEEEPPMLMLTIREERKVKSASSGSVTQVWRYSTLPQCESVSVPQNEEVLKKCAQDYLARVKQEEQRYQTLKLHAEEKLDKYVAFPSFSQQVRFSTHCQISVIIYCTFSLRANEEIAQVRAKASSESVALTASLRKEQMKNDSLEQALQQKVAYILMFL